MEAEVRFIFVGKRRSEGVPLHFFKAGKGNVLYDLFYEAQARWQFNNSEKFYKKSWFLFCVLYYEMRAKLLWNKI